MGKCLNFSFLFCKMGIMQSVSEDYEDQNTIMCKALFRSYLLYSVYCARLGRERDSWMGEPFQKT